MLAKYRHAWLLAHECNLHSKNVYRIGPECCVRWGILEMKVREKSKKCHFHIFFFQIFGSFKFCIFDACFKNIFFEI